MIDIVCCESSTPAKRGGGFGPLFFRFVAKMVPTATAFLILLALAPAGLFAEVESQQPDRRRSLQISYGVGLEASGNIIDGAASAQRFVDYLNVEGYLYSPWRRLLIDHAGPAWPLLPQPELEYYSHSGAVEYQHFLNQRLSLITAARVINLRGLGDFYGSSWDLRAISDDLPEIEWQGYLPFTKQKSAHTFGTVAQIDAGISYHFARDRRYDPYLRLYGGVGYGHLGAMGSGPVVRALHASAAAGIRHNFGERFFLSIELNGMQLYLRSPQTNPIDRTEVLINPGNGRLAISRLIYGVGSYF